MGYGYKYSMVLLKCSMMLQNAKAVKFVLQSLADESGFKQEPLLQCKKNCRFLGIAELQVNVKTQKRELFY